MNIVTVRYMKLSVLMDNNTLIDRYFTGEPGVSYLIETEGKKILFDTGYSNGFITNAAKLGIDLMEVDFLVLSHGHVDHTGGLEPLLKLFLQRDFESAATGRAVKRVVPELISHPYTFLPRVLDNLKLGPLVTEGILSSFFRLNLTKKTVWITDRLFFLGEVERVNNFEAGTPIGKIKIDGTWQDDYILDDSALVYKSDNGLIIITGCSHSGICNITEYAKKLSGENRIVDIIGGFHLLDPSDELLGKTVSAIKLLNPQKIHPCHCTDLRSKAALLGAVSLDETGSGLVLEYR